MLIFKKFFLNKYGILFFILTTVVYFIIFSLLDIVDSYQHSLKENLLSKQAHIYIKFSEDKEYNPDLVNKIKHFVSQKNIQSINAYISKKMNISIDTGFYSATNSFTQLPYIYKNSIYIIGIKPEFHSIIKSIKTYSENNKKRKSSFMSGFYGEKDIFIVNDILNKMFSRKIIFISQDSAIKTKSNNLHSILLGHYNDFSDKPVLYTNISFARKILNIKKNLISGYMIKLNDVEKIEYFVKLLRKNITSDVTITNKTETKQKQITMLYATKVLIYTFVIIIFIISVFLDILWLYGIILDKQPQIRILYNLGIDISGQIILYSNIFLFIGGFLGYISAFFLSKKIINHFFSTFTYFKNENFGIFIVSIVIFIFIYSILSKNIFSIKEKIK